MAFDPNKILAQDVAPTRRFMDLVTSYNWVSWTYMVISINEGTPVLTSNIMIRIIGRTPQAGSPNFGRAAINLKPEILNPKPYVSLYRPLKVPLTWGRPHIGYPTELSLPEVQVGKNLLVLPTMQVRWQAVPGGVQG